MMRRRLCLAAAGAAVVLAAAVLSGCGSAADLFASIDRLVFPPPPGGTLDATFGTGGKVVTEITATYYDFAFGVAVQSDGRIVVAGSTSLGAGTADIAVVRYTAAGVLDSTFDGDGKLTTAIGSGDDTAVDVAIQSDGKIVVVGSSMAATLRFAVVRYSRDGTLDTTFGGTGKVTTPIGSGAEASAVAIQGDGRIVVAGYSSNGSDDDFAVVRYTPSGALDTTFDGDGVVTTAIGSGYDEATTVTIQGDGKIVAAGYSSNGSDDDFAVVRYTSAGALDATFSGDGKVTTPVRAGTDSAQGVAVQADGKIVVAGYAGGPPDVALVRYTTSGALDVTFSGDGILTTPVGTGADSGYALAIQRDGRIVVGGASYILSSSDFAVLCCDSAGVLDPEFGNGGTVATPIGTATDSGHAVALQNDGKIVVAGFSNNLAGEAKFAVVRYWP